MRCCVARSKAVDCLGNKNKLDDLLVREFLDWLTPLEVDIGPAQLALKKAEFTDNDDNVTFNLQGFSLKDLSLTGSLTMRVPVAGDKELAASVVVDVEKHPGSDLATVAVKGFHVVDKGLRITERLLSMEKVNTNICNRLTETINANIKDRLNVAGKA